MIGQINNELYSTRRGGATLLCTLPDWWDKRGSWSLTNNGCIVIAHPDHKPMRWDNTSWVELESA